jgi:hypothetical protein
LLPILPSTTGTPKLDFTYFYSYFFSEQIIKYEVSRYVCFKVTEQSSQHRRLTIDRKGKVKEKTSASTKGKYNITILVQNLGTTLIDNAAVNQKQQAMKAWDCG